MWKITATSWSSKERQQASRSGWENRRPSTGPIGTMAADTPAPASSASWPSSHCRSRNETCPTGCRPSAAGGPHPVGDPPVPGLHVGQLGVGVIFEGPHPEQPEVGEHQCLVDTLAVHEPDAGPRVVMIGRELVESHLRGQPLAVVGVARPSARCHPGCAPRPHGSAVRRERSATCSRRRRPPCAEPDGGVLRADGRPTGNRSRPGGCRRQ